MSGNPLSVFYHYVCDVAEQGGVAIPEALRRVKSMGYDGLTFDIVFLDDRANQRRLYESEGLAVHSIYANVDFLHWEPERCSRETDDLLACAAFFGAGNVLVLPGCFEDGEDESAGLRKIYGGLEAVCRKAKDYAIDVTIENFGIKNSPNGPAAGCLACLDAVEGLKFAFDTGNFSCYGENPHEVYDLFANRLAFVHLKDRPLNPDGSLRIASAPVGDGGLDLGRLMRRMIDGGYRGGFAVEQFGLADQETALRRSADFCRRILDADHSRSSGSASAAASLPTGDSPSSSERGPR